MKRDALYARYSSHARDDGTSIEVQVEQCERAAGGKCHHYIDRAKTGRAMGGRAAMLQLLADADAGKLKRVFVYKFDRLGRDAETHMIARQLEEAGAELVSATEGTNALARGIQLVVAEDYSRQLAARTRDGLMKRFEQGAFTGGVSPYGYTVIDRDKRRVLVVNPVEAAVVREMAHWYLCESIGFKSITKRLRERAIPSRGKGWSFTSVRSLLTNPILTGAMRYNARKLQLNRTTGKRVPRFKPEAEHVTRHDESLRILDDATFAKVQERRVQGAHGKRHAPRGVHPFTNLVYCQCGAKCYRVKSNPRKESSAYYTYICGAKLTRGACPTGQGRVREDVLVKVVEGKVKRVFKHEREIVDGILAGAMEAVKGNREDASRLKRELADVDSEQERRGELLMDRALGSAAKAVINRQMTEAEQRRAELLAALDGLREDANDNTEGLAAIVAETFAMMKENLAHAIAVRAEAPGKYNRFIEDFVGSMVTTPEGAITQRKTPAAEATGGINGGSIRFVAGSGYDDTQDLVGYAER